LNSKAASRSPRWPSPPIASAARGSRCSSSTPAPSAAAAACSAVPAVCRQLHRSRLERRRRAVLASARFERRGVRRRFLPQAQAGRSIGEALGELRREASDDPTALAYAYFGDPFARVLLL
jgi:hypothetical protein